MKFKKLPVTINAWEWTGKNKDEITCFVGGKAMFKDNGELLIDTLEGPLKASKGDWVIRGVRGEFYLIKPDIMKETYEEIIPHLNDMPGFVWASAGNHDDGLGKVSVGGESFWVSDCKQREDGVWEAKVNNNLICFENHGLIMGDKITFRTT